MPKNKKSVGFRTEAEEVETQLEDWDIYPTHALIPEGYWTYSIESN